MTERIPRVSGDSPSQGYSFAVEGRPVPWARAGQQGQRKFTPKAQRAQMDLLGYAARSRIHIPMEGALTLSVQFLYKGVGPRVQRPDLDNLVKLVKDSLQGIAYKDDAQIVQLAAFKGTGPEALTRIFIQPLRREVDD